MMLRYTQWRGIVAHRKSFIKQLMLCRSETTLSSPAVELTSVRYPDVKRGKYTVLTPGHVSHFESILSKERVLTDPSDVEPYNVDWIKMVRGAFLISLVIKLNLPKIWFFLIINISLITCINHCRLYGCIKWKILW